MVSRVGDDEPGGRFYTLKFVGLDTRQITADPVHPTGCVEVRLDDRGVPDYIIHQPVAWDFIPADAPLLDLAGRTNAVCFGTLAKRSPVSRETIRTRFLRRDAARLYTRFRHQLAPGVLQRRDHPGPAAQLDGVEARRRPLPVVAQVFGSKGTQNRSRKLIDDFAIRVIAITRGTDGRILCRVET